MQEVKDAILECQVNAALAGHDLGPFEPVDDDSWQAKCRTCGETVWVSTEGLIYSMLGESCIDADESPHP